MSLSLQHDGPAAQNHPIAEETRREHTGIVPTLLSVCKAMRALNGLKLAESGFHNGQDELLFALAEGPATVSVIAGRLTVRPSTISKMADRLIEKGLLERVTDNRDARRTILRITDEGVKVQASLFAAQFQFDQDPTRHIEPATLSDIATALEELESLLAARLRRIR